MATIPYMGLCNLDTENEIAAGKENADRRTDASRDAEGRGWDKKQNASKSTATLT